MCSQVFPKPFQFALRVVLVTGCFASALPAAEGPAPQLETRALRLHDPSAVVRDGGRFWLFSTGAGVPSHSSRDLRDWQAGPPLFATLPDWCDGITPDHRGRLWAPDVIRTPDGFSVYYSISAFGKQTSAIALARSPALDPQAQGFGWKDEGVVIRSKPGDPYNAIDPCLLRDGERLWMAFGSFWKGIFLIELDPRSGLRKHPETAPVQLAWHPEIEAPYLYQRDGFYYLFVNWGTCCRGVNSTYQIRVGRSKEVAGPYLDREGIDMRKAGGTPVIASRGSFIGPGHASIVRDAEGTERLACHYYDATRRGASFLALPALRWSDDGWPEVPAGGDSSAP
jgi:arabinan endo-1,5-alpha-L-arabinosidase